MPRLVTRSAIFDLDGTLADTVPDLHRLLGELLAAEGLGAPSPAAVRGMVGDGVRALIGRAMAAIGQPADDPALDRLYARFMARYVATPCRLTALYPNVEGALRQLAADGFALGVCTNKPQRVSELILEGLGVMRYFGAVVGGDALPVRKPDPAPLALLLERLGVDREGAVMVGDSRNDLATARAAGIPCVLVGFGYSDVPARDLGANAVVDDFADLGCAIQRLGLAPGQGQQRG